MDEPDRSSKPPLEADDQPPPSRDRCSSSIAVELELFDATSSLNPSELNQLHNAADRVLEQLPNVGSVRVRIVDDHDMIQAHQRYCDLPTTTDVLTFDLNADHTDFSTKVLDTDLIVCIDEARRQSATREHTHIHELLLYIVHGVLHCLGHDDHSDEQYTRMHAKEDELLTNAGIGALFHTNQTTQQTTQQETQS